MNYDFLTEGLLFPEGPVVLPDGDLLVCEMGRYQVIRISPQGKMTVIAKIPGCANGAAIGPDGAIYLCNNGGFLFAESADGFMRVAGVPDDYKGGSIQRLDLKTGEVKTLYTECHGEKLIGPNDLVFDHDGGLWFSDLGKTRPRSMDLCAAYYCRIDGSFIREVARPFYGANGIGLSPDDKVLYVGETGSGKLIAHDIIGPGEVKNYGWRVPSGGRAIHAMAGMGRCDSLAVEANGNICVATLRTGAITVVSPEGHLVELIHMPDPAPTNICFGGDDMQTAYITLSGTGKILRMRWARPGLKLAY